MEILQQDILFGLSQEQKVMQKLANQFGNDLQKTTEQYCPYDFYTNDCKIELKSRRCSSTQYATTIIPVKKTETQGRLIFCFNFTDKLCFIEYDREKFSQYTIKDIEYVRAYGKRTSVPHYLIPCEDLTEISF